MSNLKLWDNKDTNDADLHELSSSIPLNTLSTHVSGSSSSAQSGELYEPFITSLLKETTPPVTQRQRAFSTSSSTADADCTHAKSSAECKQSTFSASTAASSGSDFYRNTSASPHAAVDLQASTQPSARKRFRPSMNNKQPSLPALSSLIVPSQCHSKRCRETLTRSLVIQDDISIVSEHAPSNCDMIQAPSNIVDRQVIHQPCAFTPRETQEGESQMLNNFDVFSEHRVLGRSTQPELLASVFPKLSTDPTRTEKCFVVDTERSSRLLQMHPRWEGFDRRELLMLLLQTTASLGYHGARQLLELESGVFLELPPVRLLHHQVLDGEWVEAVQTLKEIKGLSNRTLCWCQFFLFEQLYIELLYKGCLFEALTVLRGELKTASRFHPSAKRRIPVLCSFLMLKNPLDLCREAYWMPGTSRKLAWRQLVKFLPSTLCPAYNRLAYLLHQSTRFQELQCINHGAGSLSLLSPSLLTNHCCSTEDLPQRCIAVLEGHTDEVWNVCVSHDGRTMLSGCSHGTVLLWKVQFPKFSLIRKYARHQGSVSSLSWSWDDRYFAVSTLPQGVKIWDTKTGHSCHSREQSLTSVLRRTSRGSLEDNSVGIVRWVPRKRQLLASGNRVIVLFAVYKGRSHDVERHGSRDSLSHQDDPPRSTSSDDVPPVVSFEWPGFDAQDAPMDLTKDAEAGQSPMLGLHVEELNSWIFRKGIQDMDVNYTGTKLIVCLGDKTIRILPLSPRLLEQRHNAQDTGATCAPETILFESDITTSLCASRLCNQFLVGVSEDRHVIRLWDMSTKRVLQRYRGHQQRHFVLSASFGGCHETFVVSGSEDGRVFIWNRLYGHLLTTLKGHTGAVSAVHWPLGFDWLVSVSDDRQIRVWHSGKSSSAATTNIGDERGQTRHEHSSLPAEDNTEKTSQDR